MSDAEDNTPSVFHDVISILTCKSQTGPSVEKIILLAKLTSSLQVTNEILQLIEKYIGGKHDDVDENALILLDFLIKHGDFQFPRSCRENETLLEKLRELKERKAHSSHSLRITWILGVLANKERLQMARIRAQTDISKKNGENLLKPFWHNLQPSSRVPGHCVNRPPGSNMNGFLEMILNMQHSVDKHFENEEKREQQGEDTVTRENPFLRDQESVPSQSDIIAADLEELFIAHEADLPQGSSSEPSTPSARTFSSSLQL